MWNQQAGTANNLCLYRTSNTGVRPPQRVFSDRHTSKWQTSAVPHQAVSSQQLTGGETQKYYLKGLQGNLQNPFTNTQSGNPLLLVTEGLQVLQNFHPNSGVISSSKQSPPNMMKANTAYPQQDMQARWNQQVTMQWKPSVRTQGVNGVSDRQHCRILKSLLGSVNAELTQPLSAYTATATSLTHEQEVCTSTLISATAHNRQTAHSQNHRQNGTQRGVYPSVPPPSFHTTVSQPLRNKSITTNSSSEQILHFLSTNQTKEPKQYPIHLNSTCNNGEEATLCFLSKTNEPPLNPTADIQEQMLRHQTITKIADNLRRSFSASSDSCPPVYISSPYRGNQPVSEVTESNQNIQPAALTFTKGYNSYSSQSIPPNSGLILPKMTHSIMSRTHHSVDAPQQSSEPNVFCVTATGDGSGNGSKAAIALFPKSVRVSKSNLVGTLSDASQIMKLPESISPQKNTTESSVANDHEVLEILEILSSVKANDGSIHSSPGRIGMRAVAVVQPLSQESYQIGSKHTSSNTTNQLAEQTVTNESLGNHEKSFISQAVAKNKKTLRKGPNLYQENPNQMRSNKFVNSHSAASNDRSLVSSLDSAGHRDSSQKQLCADNTGFELAINKQVDQHVAPTAPPSLTSEMPVSQSGDEDKSENPADPETSVFDLSSLSAIPWTSVTLTKLIQDAEKAQVELSRDFTTLDSTSKLLSMFWDGNINTLECKVKTSWYKDLITYVKEFCSKHPTSDSVILSQVKDGFENQLKNFHVLKDGEVYSEPPYKSSWLNVSEQLDDTDKEFGFPGSLKHHLDMLESHSQSDQVGTVNSGYAQSINVMSNGVLSQTELDLVDSSEEKQAFAIKATSTSPAEATSTQAVPPNETEIDDSSDPYYTFKIQVLSPEEAKIIFEQVQSKMPQSIDKDSEPEGVMNSSVEGELPDAIDVTSNDSKLKNKSVCPIEEVCCASRWMEIFREPKTASSKCQCKKEQSFKSCTDETLDKKEITVEKEDNLCVNMYYTKFHMEGEDQDKGRENIHNQIMTYSGPESCAELSQIIACTENDHKPHLSSDREPKNMSQINISSSQSSTVLISENKDNLSSSDTEIQSDPEVDCAKGQIRSTGSMLLSNSSSSVETEEEQTQISATATLQTALSLSGEHESVGRKRKRRSSYNRLIPFLKKSKKFKPPVDVVSQPSTCRKVLMDATDSEPLASNVRSVQFVLFGTTPQDKCDLIGGRGRHISSQKAEFDGVPRPPEILSVKLSPLRKKSSETVPKEEHSVKRWIHEKWRQSFPPVKTRHSGKLETQTCTFVSLSGVSPEKAEMVVPTKTKKLPVSSEMRICNRNAKRCLTLKRRMSLSDRLKRGEHKMKKGAVLLKQHAKQEQSNAENESLAVTPVPENNVLRFNVLPSTFNFKDGSSDRKETNDPVTNKPALVEGKDKGLNKSVTKEIGTWYPDPEKKYHPLRSRPVQKASCLFHEFQKRYMEKTQPSMDE